MGKTSEAGPSRSDAFATAAGIAAATAPFALALLLVLVRTGWLGAVTAVEFFNRSREPVFVTGALVTGLEDLGELAPEDTMLWEVGGVHEGRVFALITSSGRTHGLVVLGYPVACGQIQIEVRPDGTLWCSDNTRSCRVADVLRAFDSAGDHRRVRAGRRLDRERYHGDLASIDTIICSPPDAAQARPGDEPAASAPIDGDSQ